ncbi:MAG: hypothetical protein OEY38_06300, partial [Gammaproteobacteria bacterium]|nr:hypothetical protein [Gammaproteobacteria bacterium]
MGLSIKTKETDDGVFLPLFEANLASCCVSMVSGSIAGNLCSLAKDQLPFWALVCSAGIFGFLFAWVVCKYLFKTAHHWYGSDSLD